RTAGLQRLSYRRRGLPCNASWRSLSGNHRCALYVRRGNGDLSLGTASLLSKLPAKRAATGASRLESAEHLAHGERETLARSIVILRWPEARLCEGTRHGSPDQKKSSAQNGLS